MQQTIWKFPLYVTDLVALEVPQGAKIISVQSQGEIPCIWMLVNPENEKIERYFETFGTGHNMQEDDKFTRQYIGTFQLTNGAFVAHVFERILNENQVR